MHSIYLILIVANDDFILFPSKLSIQRVYVPPPPHTHTHKHTLTNETKSNRRHMSGGQIR